MSQKSEFLIWKRERASIRRAARKALERKYECWMNQYDALLDGGWPEVDFRKRRNGVGGRGTSWAEWKP